MKIKCPSCKNEYECKKWLDIAKHEEEVCNVIVILPNTADYYKLIFKIHESIEYLQSRIKGDHFEDCVKLDHDFETHQEIEYALEELKSLLENGR